MEVSCLVDSVENVELFKPPFSLLYDYDCNQMCWSEFIVCGAFCKDGRHRARKFLTDTKLVDGALLELLDWRKEKTEVYPFRSVLSPMRIDQCWQKSGRGMV